MIKTILNILLISFFFTACSASTTHQSQQSVAVEWKSELFADVTIAGIAGKEQSKLIFEFFNNAGLSGTPIFSFVTPINDSGSENDTVFSYDFVDMKSGKYYLRAYLDENFNNAFDGGELTGIYSKENEPAPILVEVGSRLAISLNLE